MNKSKFIKKIDKYLTRLSIGVFLALFTLFVNSQSFSHEIVGSYSKLLFSFIVIGAVGFVMLCCKTKEPVKEIMIGMYIALGFLMIVAPVNF